MRDRILPKPLEAYRVVNMSEMATALGYSVQHLRRLCKAGRIPAPMRIGGRKLGWPISTLAALTTHTDKED